MCVSPTPELSLYPLYCQDWGFAQLLAAVSGLRPLALQRRFFGRYPFSLVNSNSNVFRVSEETVEGRFPSAQGVRGDGLLEGSEGPPVFSLCAGIAFAGWFIEGKLPSGQGFCEKMDPWGYPLHPWCQEKPFWKSSHFGRPS